MLSSVHGISHTPDFSIYGGQKKERNAYQSGLIFQKDLLLHYVPCITGTNNIFQNFLYLTITRNKFYGGA
jgi:hypothetical protein